MTRHEEDEAFTINATLRNFAPVQPFCVRWNYPLLELAEELDPDDLKKPASSQNEPKYSDEEILAPLAGGGMGFSDWKHAVMNSTGMAARTFALRRAALVKRGIVREENGEYVIVAEPKA